jgi:hypothetical protein
VSSLDFEFHMRVDAGPSAHALAENVAAEVFRHVGCADEAGARSALHAAIGEICGATGACAVGFRARGGMLDITVTAGSASRHLQQPIP